MNNFLNNAEQKIILCKMLEIILCYLVLCLCLFVDYPKKKKTKNYKELEFTKLEFHITYFYVSVYLSIIPKNKKKKKRKNKVVRNSSLVSSSTLEKHYQAFYLQRTQACMLEFHIKRNSSLPNLSTTLFFLLHKFQVSSTTVE